jgi:hypothetical protein
MGKCLTCDDLTLAALDASRLYHDLLGALEAAYISKDTDSITTSTREQLDKATRQRCEAIAQLTDHRRVH